MKKTLLKSRKKLTKSWNEEVRNKLDIIEEAEEVSEGSPDISPRSIK